MLQTVISLTTVCCLWTICSASTLMFYQSSKYNDNSPDLASDGDVTTCSATGFTKGSWWKVDLGEDVAVKGVHLTGSAGAFEVRVGYGHQDIEERRGFESNPYCGNGPGLTLDDTMELTCQRVRVGRYISIHVIDPTVFRQLKLCEVEVVVDEE